MTQARDELLLEKLAAIARRAADAILAVTGDDSAEQVLSLRSFDPNNSHLPANDLYELLRTAEHVHARQNLALARKLRRYGRVVERTC